VFDCCFDGYNCMRGADEDKNAYVNGALHSLKWPKPSPLFVVWCSHTNDGRDDEMRHIMCLSFLHCLHCPHHLYHPQSSCRPLPSLHVPFPRRPTTPLVHCTPSTLLSDSIYPRIAICSTIETSRVLPKMREMREMMEMMKRVMRKMRMMKMMKKRKRHLPMHDATQPLRQACIHPVVGTLEPVS